MLSENCTRDSSAKQWIVYLCSFFLTECFLDAGRWSSEEENGRSSSPEATREYEGQGDSEP
jgi:hypothetical protein